MNSVPESNHNGGCQDGDPHEEASPEQSVSAENSDTCSVFGNPEVLPRVGEEYQVEIPPFLKNSDCLSIANIKHHKEIRYTCDFHMGLAIPIMWINREDKKHEFLKFEKFANDDLKENISDMDLKVSELVLKQKIDAKMHEDVVPGSSRNSWSDMEEASFLLSLYIFGKDLVQVKKFVEGRKMGDVLSFYYGKFYRSEKYRRWSECRKMRGRRCIYGQRLFTGWRHHELLSRLFPDGSEDRKSAWLEVSKTFTEGKIQFEDYVFSLKAIVGLKDLIEAVGIGRGKEDLTGFAMDPLKTNQAASIRPEIPSGKACSTLTPSEIVKFLTGDFRLSKTRTSDLFWEAVWPRLLARGWHSEQPRHHAYAIGTKHSLVFLIPGINKFSGRKLVKGNHYFDSVSDVLSKVASNPWLLEFENGSDRAGENGWNHKMKLDKEDRPNQQPHCYLQPRTPNHDSDAMKFTIVDTSLGCAKICKIMRSLPVEITINSNGRSRSDSKDSDVVSTENSINNLDCDENSCGIMVSLDHVMSLGEKDFSPDAFSQRPRSSSQRTRPNVENRMKKRRRQDLTGCDQSETSQKSKRKEVTCYTDSSDQFQEKSSSNSWMREHARDTSQPRELINLNMPIPQDDEIGESSMVKRGDRQGQSNHEYPPSSTKTSQNKQNLRRQSTRNRPLTTKALEALALGFLDIKQKRKCKDRLRLGPSRHARADVKSSENSKNSTEDWSISNGNCEFLQ